MSEQQLTCELNGIKYLRYCITLPVQSSASNKIGGYLDSFEAIEIGIEYKREGGWLFGLRLVVLSFLIPENRVIEFSKSEFPT